MVRRLPDLRPAGGWPLALSVVGSLELTGRDVAAVLVEAAMAETSRPSAANSTSSMDRQGLRV